jgi:DNA-binding transcriptional regulator YdaS (Cro superfamily)
MLKARDRHENRFYDAVVKQWRLTRKQLAAERSKAAGLVAAGGTLMEEVNGN